MVYNNSKILIFFSSNKEKVSGAPIEIKRCQRPRKEKHLFSYFISSWAIVFLVESNRESLQNKIPILLNVENDSKIFSVIMSSRDASFRRGVVNDEMD